MSGQVVSLQRFSDDAAKQLEDAGVDVRERVDLDELNLPEPGYGETFVAHAEDDEAAVLVAFRRSKEQWERRQRDLIADTMSKAGQVVRDSDLSKPWTEVFNEGGVKPEFADDADAEAFFRLGRRTEFLFNLLYWKVGERLGLHGYRLGLRRPMKGEDKLRVVKMDKRW